MSSYKITLTLSILAISALSYGQLQVEEYTLDNGLTVILNPDSTTQSIFGAVAVNTGSKNDPEEATGLSHYLEHLLFKGTEELGTWNYEKEKPFLDSIRIKYDELGMAKSSEERTKIQQKINDLSIQASKYAMPNEFDKLLKSIGATGVNATTNSDLTIYFNSFPSHQVEKWLSLYAHRFEKPVFRSFQSELEVVYEEKNRAMDNRERRIFETYMKEFYKGHPYGERDNLGTIEHLKNPSLNKMYEYFEKYYVANNMALILCGNFKIEDVKPYIQTHFSNLRRSELVKPQINAPIPFKGRQVFTKRITPIGVGVLGFRTVPRFHEDEVALDVISYMLQNDAGTGFIDQLEDNGKLMNAWAFGENMDEAGHFYFIFIPKILIQSLNKGEKIILREVEKIKTGDFTNEQLESIKSELYRNQQLNIEDPLKRGYYFARFYTNDIDQNKYNYLKQLENISKEEIVRIAKKYFGNDYLFMKSKTGFPKATKLEKPNYSPAKIDQSKASLFANRFNAMESKSIRPKFLNFNSDVQFSDLTNGNKLYVTKNPVNDIFTLKMVIQKGSYDTPLLNHLSKSFEYLHPKNKTLEAFRSELAVIGAKITTSTAINSFTIKLEGIENQLDKSIELMSELLNEPSIDDLHLSSYKTQQKTLYNIEKDNAIEIARALAQYGLYGEGSPSRNRLSYQEVKSIKKTELIDLLTQLKQYNATFHFIGKTGKTDVQNIIKERFDPKKMLKNEYEIDFPVIDRKENELLIVDNKKILQSHIFIIANTNSQGMDNLSDGRLFNAYYGGGFSGLLKQEIREYRSLAYSTSGGFRYNNNLNNDNYFFTYIGTQADKTSNALKLSISLIRDLPKKEDRLDYLKSNIKLNLSNLYPNFRSLSSEIESYRLRGIDQDPNIKVFEKVENATFNDLYDFYVNNVRDKHLYIGIHGDMKRFKSNLNEIGFSTKVIDRSEVIKF